MMQPEPDFDRLKAATPRLEPMTVGMILDAAVRIYMRHRWVLLGIVSLAYLPQLLLWILAAAGERLGDDWTLVVALLTVLGYLVWFAILQPFAMGAAAVALSQAYLGEDPDTGRALRTSLSRLGSLLLTGIAVGLIVLLGFVLLIVPGILWWLTFSMVIPVVVLEEANVEKALSRSAFLTRDNRGKIFLVLLVIGFFQAAFQFGGIGLMAAFGMGVESLPSQIVQLASAIALAPLSITATILLYYDLRIRKEGFDLEVLSGLLTPLRDPSDGEWSPS